MGRKKKAPEDELLTEPGRVWGDPNGPKGQYAKEIVPSSTPFPTDGTMFKSLRSERVGSLEDFVNNSWFSNFANVIAVDRTDKMVVDIPVLNRNNTFSEFTFPIGGYRLDFKGTVQERVDLLLLQLFRKSVDPATKLPLPEDFSHIEAAHTAIRDASTRKMHNFALITSDEAGRALNKFEDSVKDVVNYSAGDTKMYAGIPIFSSKHVPAGEMYVINRETACIGYRDMVLREGEQVGVGAAFTPDVLAYGAAEGCHFVTYDFSDETNDFCIDCETCGYSYWAGTEQEAVERLHEHTEEKVYMRRRDVWP